MACLLSFGPRLAIKGWHGVVGTPTKNAMLVRSRRRADRNHGMPSVLVERDGEGSEGLPSPGGSMGPSARELLRRNTGTGYAFSENEPARRRVLTPSSPSWWPGLPPPPLPPASCACGLGLRRALGGGSRGRGRARVCGCVGRQAVRCAWLRPTHGLTCRLLTCSQAARHIHAPRHKRGVLAKMSGGKTDGRTAKSGDLVPVQLSGARVSGEGNAPAPPVDDSAPKVHSI